MIQQQLSPWLLMPCEYTPPHVPHMKKIPERLGSSLTCVPMAILCPHPGRGHVMEQPRTDYLESAWTLAVNK